MIWDFSAVDIIASNHKDFLFKGEKELSQRISIILNAKLDDKIDQIKYIW